MTSLSLGLAVLGYLCGSLPTGLLLAYWLKGVDLRTVGSGNIGATNTSRVLGKTWGLVALLLDAAKGALPTVFLPLAFPGTADEAGAAPVVTGTAAILGHMFPVWLGFRGGKGVATSLGVAAVLAPWGTLAAAGAFLLVFWRTRIVSLGSIIAAVVFAAVQLPWLWAQPAGTFRTSRLLFSVAVPTLIIVLHRSNIRRLLRGEEGALKTAASGSSVDAQPDGPRT